MPSLEAMIDCPGAEALERLAVGDAADPSLRAHLERCQSCRATIEAIRADNMLIEEWREAELPGPSTDVRSQHDASVNTAEESQAPSIPGFEIRAEIGRGGQGVVYDAVQTATRRRVALKLLLHGPYSTLRQRRRFEREIEAVASLRHPGIVTLYESGTTPEQGMYFAMEYIEGHPLDGLWAERRQGLGMPIDDTLRLFAEICGAVAHAHQRGVIHRDLKPSNILMDEEGTPRILDFGLARIDRGESCGGSVEANFAGTLSHAAPEQIAHPGESGDVRVDVYALGIILHELLLGRSPFEECDSLPSLISRKNQSLAAGALERSRIAGVRLDRDSATILRKAMAVDPARRYQSASELLSDVQRRIERRPIAARQDSLPYVLWKGALRHRRLVAVSGVVTCALVVLLGMLAVSTVQHAQQRQRAVDTLQAFRDSLSATDPLGGRRWAPTMAGFLADVGEHVNRQLDDEPEVAAALHSTLGQIAVNSAEYGIAEGHLQEALRLAMEVGDELMVAEATHHLGRLAFFRGRYADAAALYRDALQRRRHLRGADHAEVATSGSHLASCLRRLGQFGEAESLLRESLRVRLESAESPAELAAAWNNLGSLVLEMARPDEALLMFDRALEIVERGADSQDWRIAHALRNRAACLIELDRLEEAEAALATSEGVWLTVVEDDHPALAAVRHLQASAALKADRLSEAAQRGSVALESRRARLGQGHPDVAESLHLLGLVAQRCGLLPSAREFFDEALTIRRSSLPPEHWAIAASAGELGSVLAALGAPEAARPLLLESHLIWSRQRERWPQEAAEAAERLRSLGVAPAASGSRDRVAPSPHRELE